MHSSIFSIVSSVLTLDIRARRQLYLYRAFHFGKCFFKLQIITNQGFDVTGFAVGPSYHREMLQMRKTVNCKKTKQKKNMLDAFHQNISFGLRDCVLPKPKTCFATTGLFCHHCCALMRHFQGSHRSTS